MDLPVESQDLRRIPAILLRRRWVIYLAVIATVLVALVGSYMLTPLYRATVTLQIERHNPNILTFGNLGTIDYGWGAYTDFYQTQYKILSSDAVARTAVERMGLVSHPNFAVGDAQPGLRAKIRSLIPRKGPRVETSPVDRAAAMVQAGLEVEPIKNSQLVRVSWISSEPDLAAQVANGVADAFIHHNLASKYSTNDQATEFLVDQVHTLKEEIFAIESRLQTYGESKGIVSIDQANNVTLQALQDIAEEWTTAQTALARAKSRFDAARNSPPEGFTEVMNSGLIGRLREEYASYEAEYTERAKLFKDDWPELQTLKSRLEQARRRLELETERIADHVVATAESEYLRARSSVENLERLLDTQEIAAQRLKRDAVEYENLRGESQKKREALDALMKRQNEISLSGQLQDLEATNSNVHIMEQARTPAAPFRPNIKLNLIIGLTLGLSLGVGMAFLLDFVDNTINTADELKRILSMPLLAVIPRHTLGGSYSYKPRRKPVPGPPSSIDLVAQLDGRTSAAESYRELRTSLLLSHAGKPPRSIMITSAVPSEGKTATAVNLAIVLSQLGKRVLLVDTDLRRPRLHKVFNVDNHQGTSTFLSGLESTPGPLIRSTMVENLDLLTSGPIPPNPSELLNSKVFSGMDPLLAGMGYEHVVFDSPPAIAVADPLIIANTVDVSILVVKAGKTQRNLVRMAAEKLTQATSGTFGSVLNNVAPDNHGAGLYRYESVYMADSESVEPPTTRVSSAGAWRPGSHVGSTQRKARRVRITPIQDSSRKLTARRRGRTPD